MLDLTPPAPPISVNLVPSIDYERSPQPSPHTPLQRLTYGVQSSYFVAG